MNDSDAVQGFIVLAQQVDGWWRRFEDGVGQPAKGSPLFGDDEWTTTFPLSQAAWHAISAAIDNLHAFRTLTVSGGPTDYHVNTRPYGCFPNLRAGMENAATAIWMLAPNNRAERVARYLRWCRQETWYRRKALQLQGSTAPDNDAMHEWIDAVIEARAISYELLKDRPRFEEMIFLGAEHVGMTGNVGQLVWQTMSGMAHGERWASLTLNDMEQTGSLPNPEHVTVRVTTPAGRLILFATVASRYLSGALDLLDKRRASPY